MNYTNTVSVRTLSATILTILLGAFAVWGSMYLGMAIDRMYSWETALLSAPFIEEGLKFIPVFVLFFAFRKRMNPLALGLLVALGFAIAENIIFAYMSSGPFGDFYRIPALFLHIIATALATCSIVICVRKGWLHSLWAFPLFLLLACFLHLGFNLAASLNWFMS